MMQLSTSRSSPGRRLQMSDRELLRQHGNGAIGKVDAGSAQARFKIEIGCGANVFRHVGNVDLQFIAAVGALGYEHRIVKIAGRFAVDGDDGQTAKISAASNFSRIEMRNATRFGQNIVRERRAAADACGSSSPRRRRSRRVSQEPQSRGQPEDGWAWASW